MAILSKALSAYKEFIPSVKLRLGTDVENIEIVDYLRILQVNGIKKVYVHARPLRYNYTRPSLSFNFHDLEKKFSDLTLIYNGDIDSPNLARNYDNVMIGRAALINPFIFQDIKSNKLYREGEYNPSLKDPHLVRNTLVSLSEEKIAIICEFLDLAIKYNLRPILAKNNLSYLLKGVSRADSLVKLIRQSESIEAMLLAFNDWVN